MTHFNESFYTDDFDQEMIDFIVNVLGMTCTGEYCGKAADLNDNWLICSGGVDWFFTYSRCAPTNKCLTKQQFKERIGMRDTKKEFTKDDLLVGDVVYLREPLKEVDYWIKYDQDKLVSPREIFYLNRLTHNLKHDIVSSCDIMLVYRGGELIWEREELSEKGIKIKELEETLQAAQNTLSEMQGNVDKIKQQINELKS